MAETETRTRSSLLLDSDCSSEAEEDDDVLTQPIEKPLSGVIAYVDVRLGKDRSINTSQSISGRLVELGAKVIPRLTKEVTHLVYKDGKTNLDKVNRKSIFIVSPLWVESCSRCKEQVSEAKYPVIAKETCGGVSGSPVVLGKIKRIKSMQPKPLVMEEVTKSVERNRKRMAKIDEKSSTEKRSKRPSLEVPGDPFEFDSVNDSDDNMDTVEANKDSPISDKQVRQNSKKQPIQRTPSTAAVTGKMIPSSRNTEPKNLSKVNPCKVKKTKILKAHEQNTFKEDSKTNKGKKRSLDNNDAVDQTRGQENQSTKDNNAECSTTMADDEPPQQPDTDHVVVKTEGGSLGYSKRHSRPSFNRIPSIVLTSLDQKDRETISAVIDKLGGFEVSQTVGETTTHLVCGAARRTVNVLAGTAKGCWLLSVDWVFRSLEVGKWMDEGAFEMVTEFPAAQFFRMERFQAGLLYRPSLFYESGSIYISQNTKPSPKELEMLLSLAGAKITGSKLKADVCVGNCPAVREGTVKVSEQWIIDSITEHRMLPVEEYALDKDGFFARSNSPEL